MKLNTYYGAEDKKMFKGMCWFYSFSSTLAKLEIKILELSVIIYEGKHKHSLKDLPFLRESD